MPFDRERAATVLADAIVSTDARAAHRWGVSERSVRLWRARLERDEMLAHLFQQKRIEVRAAISERLDDAMLGAVAFLAEASAHADPASLDAVHTIAGALKMLAEAKIGLEILGARTRADDRATRTAA